MLDVALLMANASQLKAMLEQGPGASFYTPIVALISMSLFLQVAVGILLVFTGEKIKAESVQTGRGGRFSTNRAFFFVFVPFS